MQVVYVKHFTGSTDPGVCLGFTPGKEYKVTSVQQVSDGYSFLHLDDDQGYSRCRPAGEFAEVKAEPIRRAWARFPSLQSVLGG